MRKFIIAYKLVDSDETYELKLEGRYEESHLVYESMVYLRRFYREVTFTEVG